MKYYSFSRPLAHSWVCIDNAEIEDGGGPPGPYSILTCARLPAARVDRLELVPHVDDDELAALAAGFRAECERHDVDFDDAAERVGIPELLAETCPFQRARMVAGARYDRTFPALTDEVRL